MNKIENSMVNSKAKKNRFKSMAMLPGVGLALVPKLRCPACWPVYSGLLSSLGLGFINYTPYLLPLTLLFLALAVASLGYRATSRQDYKPFMLGMLAAVVVITGKFLFAEDLAMYGGIVLLMGASLWNSWPKRKAGIGSCSLCVPAGTIPSNNKGTRITSERS